MYDRLIAKCLATTYQGYYWNPREQVLYSALKGNHLQLVPRQLPCKRRGVEARFIIHTDAGAIGVEERLFCTLDASVIAERQPLYTALPTLQQLRARRLRAKELSEGDRIICVAASVEPLRYGAIYIVDSIGTTSGEAWATIHNAANVTSMIKVTLELRDNINTARYFVMSNQKETNVQNLFNFLAANRVAASKDLKDDTNRPTEVRSRRVGSSSYGRPHRTAEHVIHDFDQLDDSDAYR